MKLKFLTFLGVLLWLLMAPVSSWAANMTCTMQTTPAGTPATVYSPYAANNTALSYTVRCTRNANGAGTLSYKIGNNNGLNQGGTATNRASLTSGGTTYYVPYDLYTTSSTVCGGTPWQTSVDLANSLTWSGNIRQIDTPHNFYLCIPIFAGATFPIEGTYSDTVLLNLNTPVTSSGDTFSPAAPSPFAIVTVTITVAKECALTTSPAANINFGTYNSLTNSALNANTPFVTRCTNQGTYTMSLEGASTGSNTNPVNGVLAGLNYSLGISGTAASGSSVGGATVSTTGNGAGQTYYINAYMPGGQAGSCASGCGSPVSSPSHTLTVTY